MYPRLLFCCIALGINASFAGAESFTITIKAVDADNKPVAKAEMATHWEAKDGTMIPSYPKDIVTDADGKANMVVDDWNEKRPVMVLSADRKLGAIVDVSKEDDGKELTVALGPTVRLRGKFECKELNLQPKWMNTMATADGFPAGPVGNISTSSSVDMIVPVGKYKLSMYGTDVVQAKLMVTVTADEPVHDLGTIDLKGHPIAKMKGKPPADLVFTDARGVKKDMKLSDFKGKWVYIEFWGFW